MSDESCWPLHRTSSQIVVDGKVVDEPPGAQVERCRKVFTMPCTLCGGTNPACHVCKSLAKEGVEKP